MSHIPLARRTARLSYSCARGAQSLEESAIEEIEEQEVFFVGVEHCLFSGGRDMAGREQGEEGGAVCIFNGGAEMREGVGARRDVPDANTLVVSGRYEVVAAVGPDDAVAGADVGFAMFALAGVFAEAVFAANAD